MTQANCMDFSCSRPMYIHAYVSQNKIPSILTLKVLTSPGSPRLIRNMRRCKAMRVRMHDIFYEKKFMKEVYFQMCCPPRVNTFVNFIHRRPHIFICQMFVRLFVCSLHLLLLRKTIERKIMVAFSCLES
jgi:hypothetical protein